MLERKFVGIVTIETLEVWEGLAVLLLESERGKSRGKTRCPVWVLACQNGKTRKKVRAGGSGERYLKRCKNSWCQLQLSAPYDVTLAGTPVHHMAMPRLHVLIA